MATTVAVLDGNGHLSGKPLDHLKGLFPAQGAAVSNVSIVDGKLTVTQGDGTSKTVDVPATAAVAVVDNGDGTATIG